MPRFEKSVEEVDGGWQAVCRDTVLDEPCFRSSGWDSEAKAKTRIREHLYEHAENVPAREIAAFELGLTQEEYEVRVAELVERNKVVLDDEELDEGGKE